MEWLKHSNKSTKKCDICDTPYKFRTIYDPNMPKNIPMGLLWEKLYQTMTKGVIKPSFGPEKIEAWKPRMTKGVVKPSIGP